MGDEWKEYWFPQEGKRIMLSKYTFVNAFIVLFFDIPNFPQDPTQILNYLWLIFALFPHLL